MTNVFLDKYKISIPNQFKISGLSLLIISTFLFCSSHANGTNYYSNGNGNPALTSRWSTGTGTHPNDFLNAADNFIIQTGHTLTASSTWTVAGIVTISAGGTLARGTYNIICGSLVINGISDNSNGGSFTINGNVSGAGSITAATTTQRVFYVTGDWTFSGTIPSSVDISLTMNGTGNQTLSGIISNGTNPSFLIINKSSGKVTLGSNITTGTNGTFTLTAGTFDPSTYLLTATTPTFTAGTLNVGATTWGGNYSFTVSEPAAGTIEYYMLGNQTVNNVNTYGGDLILSGSGVKTLGTSTTTIGGDLTLSGTVTTTTVAAMTINGNLTVENGTTLTAAGFPLTVSGTTTIGTGSSGTLSIPSATGTKTFTGAVTINSGGAITETAAATLSFGSDITISGILTENGSAIIGIAGSLLNNGTYTTSTGTHTFSGSTKTIDGTATVTIPNVAITGTYSNNGTLTCNGTLSGSGTLINTDILNIGGTCSVISLSNSGTLGITGTGTISTALANLTNTGIINLGGSGNISGITNNTGGTVNLSNSGTITSFNNATSTSILNISDLTPTITTLTISISGNTVNYSGTGAQSVLAKAYSNLTLSGSGAKSIATGTSVTGTISISPSGSATASIGTGLTITVGSLMLGGSGTTSGSWGSTTSTATYKNNTYFAATTGKLNVGSDICTSPTITGNLSFCNGSTTQLSGSGTAAGTNPWISGSTGIATINTTGLVTGLAAGTSTITYTNNLGCVKTATVTVSASPSITSTSTGTICTGVAQNYIITSGVAGTTYNWSRAAVSGISNTTVSGQSASTITETLINTTSSPGANAINVIYLITPTVSGCAGTTFNYTVTVNPLPNNTTAGFSGNTICAGDNGVLTFDAYDDTFALPYVITYTDGTTIWSQTISSASSTVFNTAVNPNISTIYTLKSINNGKCTTTSGFQDTTAQVTVKPIFTSGTISSTGETICYNGDPGIIGNSIVATGGDGNITYKWQADGIDIPGANTYTYDPPSGLKTNTTYTRWANDGTCNTTSTQSVGSWDVIVKQNVPVSVNIVASSNPACLGTDVTFTANPTNGGTTPEYQWNLNGIYTGINSLTYINSTLANGDYVTCVMTSNETCIISSTATSNIVAMEVNNPPAAPTVGEITQPMCPILTGTVILNNLPSGNWTINPGNVLGTESSVTVSGIAAGTTRFTVTDDMGCISSQSEVVSITDIVKRWIGSNNSETGNDWFTDSNWNPEGVPNATDCIEIPNNEIAASVTGTNKTAHINTLTVSDEGKLNVSSGNTLVVQDFINVNPGGTMILEDSASLIQVNDASDLNTGNITVKRNSAPLILNDYTYWSSPTSGTQTLQDFSPNSNPKYFLTYDDTWSFLNAVTTKFDTNQKGIGYAIIAPKGISSPTKFPFSFTGVPNNGDVTVQVSSGSIAAPSYKLVGNPYPSALDADAFILANLFDGINRTISGALYFLSRDATLGSYAAKDYSVYNLAGGVPKSTDSKLWIATGQGFVVETLSAGEIIFTNDMRNGSTSTSNSNFCKNVNNPSAISDLKKNRIWINLTNSNSSFNQILLGYIETATNGYDPGFDGKYISTNKTGLYSILEKSNFTIQAKSLPFIDSDIVPLGYVTDVKGNLTISIDSVDGLFEKDQDIFIEDKLLNIIHNLKASPYTFTTDTGTFNDRFSLRYTNKNLSSSNPKQTTNKEITVSSKNHQIKIQSTMDDNISKVFVYDILGRTIYQTPQIDSKETLISDLKTQQVLIIKVVLSNGFSCLKKLINQ